METTRLNNRVSSEDEAETTDAVDTIAFCSHQLLRLCASSDRRREDLPPDFLEFRRIFTASTSTESISGSHNGAWPEKQSTMAANGGLPRRIVKVCFNRRKKEDVLSKEAMKIGVCCSFMERNSAAGKIVTRDSIIGIT